MVIKKLQILVGNSQGQISFSVCMLCIELLFLLTPRALRAEAAVELWGHPDCPPCVKIKRVLQKRGIPFTTHDLHDKQVEKYYVRTFGRGSIPVARVGQVVIRGDYPERVVKEYYRQGGGAAGAGSLTAAQDERLQRCVNGQLLEDFYAEEKRARRRYGPSVDLIDIVLDKCYGAVGRLICADEEVPFSAIKKTADSYEVVMTYQQQTVTKPLSCRLVRY